MNMILTFTTVFATLMLAVAVMENGLPVIKKSNTQKDTIPSIVSITRKGIIHTGDTAANKLANQVLRATKTWDGRTASTDIFKEFKRTMGTVEVYHSKNLKKGFTSQQLSAEIIKALADAHPVLFSRYSTIAEAVGEFVLDNEIEYYNHIGWFSGKADKALMLERFCYRYAATVRFKDRCRLNINITMGRKEDAPLFSKGMPDKLIFESERKKRNAGICAILSALSSK